MTVEPVASTTIGSASGTGWATNSSTFTNSTGASRSLAESNALNASAARGSRIGIVASDRLEDRGGDVQSRDAALDPVGQVAELGELFSAEACVQVDDVP